MTNPSLYDVTFNLSILECKLNNGALFCVAVTLLISPYWNVNQHTHTLGVKNRHPFNLSILECKYAEGDSTTASGKNF